MSHGLQLVHVCTYGVHYTIGSILLKFEIFENRKLKNESLTTRIKQSDSVHSHQWNKKGKS